MMNRRTTLKFENLARRKFYEAQSLAAKLGPEHLTWSLLEMERSEWLIYEAEREYMRALYADLPRLAMMQGERETAEASA